MRAYLLHPCSVDTHLAETVAWSLPCFLLWFKRLNLVANIISDLPGRVLTPCITCLPCSLELLSLQFCIWVCLVTMGLYTQS